jgi:hypothetical protein
MAMLECLSHALQMVMGADSGCKTADLTANRYGCLCRRRAKYLITTTVPVAKIAGRAITEIFADRDASDRYAGTGMDNFTDFRDHGDYMPLPGDRGYHDFKVFCKEQGFRDPSDCAMNMGDVEDEWEEMDHSAPKARDYDYY